MDATSRKFPPHTNVESDVAPNNKTFEQLAALESGTILVDRFEEGLRFIIMRGPGSLCAYVGVPESHPLAGFNYEDLNINCHGGLTFARKGGDDWPEGFFWYGWDYNHSGDRSFSDLRYNSARVDEKGWTVKDVESESWMALWDFRKLMKLAEEVTAKAKGWR